MEEYACPVNSSDIDNIANSNSNTNTNTIKSKKPSENKLYVARRKLIDSPGKYGMISHSGILQIYRDNAFIIDYDKNGTHIKKIKDLNIAELKKSFKFKHDGHTWTKQKHGSDIDASLSPCVLKNKMDIQTKLRGYYDMFTNNCHMAQECLRESVGLMVDSPYVHDKIDKVKNVISHVKIVSDSVRNCVRENVSSYFKLNSNNNLNLNMDAKVSTISENISDVIINGEWKNMQPNETIFCCEDLVGKKINIVFSKDVSTKILNYMSVEKNILNNNPYTSMCTSSIMHKGISNNSAYSDYLNLTNKSINLYKPNSNIFLNQHNSFSKSYGDFQLGLSKYGDFSFGSHSNNNYFSFEPNNSSSFKIPPIYYADPNIINDNSIKNTVIHDIMYHTNTEIYNDTSKYHISAHGSSGGGAFMCSVRINIML